MALHYLLDKKCGRSNTVDYLNMERQLMHHQKNFVIYAACRSHYSIGEA